MRCIVCGATCRCRGSNGDVCCSCHTHKPRPLKARWRALQRDEIPDRYWPDVQRLLLAERDRIAASGQLELFGDPAPAPH